MLTASEIEQKVLIRLQDYPEIAARYATGDPTIKANLAAQITMLGLIGFEVDISEVEPFMKTRERTILADATNKGILPIAIPCKHVVRAYNSHKGTMTISAGRYIEDVQGRTWRLLETANIPTNGQVDVMVEQSELRTFKYTAVTSDPFQQVNIDLQDDMHLANISLKDNENNHYAYKPKWMNVEKGEYAVNFKTDSRRRMIVEFGDSNRFGRTLIANTEIEFTVIETYGEIDVSKLKEASLSEVKNSNEQKLTFKFLEGGLKQNGVDPLSTDQLQLLSSYPNYDENAVLLGEFTPNVRKKFMGQTDYINVWNESIHEVFYGANINNINHLFVALKPKNPDELIDIQTKVAQYIGILDNLYKSKVKFMVVEERSFNLKIKGTLDPVHNIEDIKQQVTTFLLGLYGHGKLAASYNLPEGFNIQKMSKLITENIPAFQDQISDFMIISEDLNNNPIQPHQWVYLDSQSIQYDLKSRAGHSQGHWSL